MRDVSVRYPERPEEGSNRMWTLNNHLTEEQRHRVAEWLHMLGVERASFTAVQDLSDVRIEFRRAAPPVPALPRRDDAVAAWLRRWREEYPPSSDWHMLIDTMLDDYRLHADTGTPLDEHACDGPHCCEGET